MKQKWKKEFGALRFAGVICILLAMLLCVGCEEERVELPSGSPLVPTPSQSGNSDESVPTVVRIYPCFKGLDRI